MDKELTNIIALACTRGSKYVKGDTAIKELPEKIAELGILLLTKASKVAELHGDRLREELNEIQQKIDDTRKAIFSNKLKKI